MIDEKIAQNNKVYFDNNGKWEEIGRAEEFKLEQENKIEWETFNPTIREQSKELIIPFDTKPFKIYNRTKNRRIKNKQIKKSSFLKFCLYVKNTSGISNIIRGVNNDK